MPRTAAPLGPDSTPLRLSRALERAKAMHTKLAPQAESVRARLAAGTAAQDEHLALDSFRAIESRIAQLQAWFDASQASPRLSFKAKREAAKARADRNRERRAIIHRIDVLLRADEAQAKASFLALDARLETLTESDEIVGAYIAVIRQRIDLLAVLIHQIDALGRDEPQE